jgi:EpsI family protein
MDARMLAIRLPAIPLRLSLILSAAMMLAAMLAYWATPHLVEVTDAPSLEDTVPRQFGDWRELPTPYAQVSLSTGNDPNMENPYDQTVMRTYVNGKGQQVMLALAWGKRQRQEVKIHRPDLCYVAQGYKIQSLKAVTYANILAPSGEPIVGNHMYAQGNRGGEAVSYWVRIGDIYSEDAFETRFHIFREGLKGRVPDGILVRASVRVRDEGEAQKVWPLMDQFLADLAAMTPPSTKSLLVR